MNTIRTLKYEIEIVIWSYVSVEWKKENIHLSELSDIRFSSVTIILAINTGGLMEQQYIRVKKNKKVSLIDDLT